MFQDHLPHTFALEPCIAASEGGLCHPGVCLNFLRYCHSLPFSKAVSKDDGAAVTKVLEAANGISDSVLKQATFSF